LKKNPLKENHLHLIPSLNHSDYPSTPLPR
jgi:hypothetical protein